MRTRNASQIAIALLLVMPAGGCATVNKVFGGPSSEESRSQAPISNPFGPTYAGGGPGYPSNMVLRSRRGDRSVELELPGYDQDRNDLTVPFSPDSVGRGPASEDGTELEPGVARKRVPTAADREITSSFPHTSFEDAGKRAEIEEGLGLMAAENTTPEHSTSYLAGIDQIKRLYRGGRYEAALLEADDMIREYPTDPKLHQMRGTLLDRLGRGEMAIRSWEQALRFDPKNRSLRRYIDRKRSLAGVVERGAALQKEKKEGGE
jgi:tetratricopeptide (TPR) repeat protein